MGASIARVAIGATRCTGRESTPCERLDRMGVVVEAGGRVCAGRCHAIERRAIH